MLATLEARDQNYYQEVEGIFSFQLFSGEVCQEVIELLRCEAAWVAAPIVQSNPEGTYQTVAVPQTRAADGFSPNEQSPVRRIFDQKIRDEVIPLVNKVWQSNLRRHDSTHVVRYRSGDFYLPHRDDFPDDTYRYFTALCYLNDDFSGGETDFPTIEFSIKPSQGKMIVFPSSYLHCSKPVLAGEKFIFVTWLVGPSPQPWI